MYYSVSTEKSLYEATVDLRAAILRLGFAILHVQELSAPGSGWNVECDEDCTVFLVDNFRCTERLLAVDMRCAMALPWRIAVYTAAGVTRIGLLRPQSLLATLSADACQTEAARDLDERLKQIVDETR